MATPMNSLKVRRVDLLEQLQERYDSMTLVKEKYEKLFKAYEIACDKYFKDVEAHERRIDDFLRGCTVGGEVSWRSYGARYSDPDQMIYRVTSEVSVSQKDVLKAVGPEPTKPVAIEMPSFLRERRGRGYTVEPSIYEAVYQAIAVLSMSNDEEVKAQMFNDALIAL